MWKVVLLLAFVASFTIIRCDDSVDSSNDDSDSVDTSYARTVQSSSKKLQSSSSSSQSSSSSSESLTSDSKQLKSSKSLSSESASSLSEESSSKISDYTSKKRQTIDSDDDAANSSSDHTNESAGVDTTAQDSVDVNTSDSSVSENDGDDNVAAKKSVPACRCGPNQVVSDCINGGCELRNCSQAGQPIRCVRLDPKYCLKGCVCKSGYLRAKNGTCVPQNQCNEGCNNDPNSHPGCGVNCGRTCSTYKRHDVACAAICYDNGCDCNNGYVYDDNPAVQKCVLPKNCSPQCGRYEVFSNCTNGGCELRNCSQAGQPIRCVRLDPKYCLKGCVCQSGYLRAKNGTCVPQNQCNEGCKNDPNSHPGCGVNCGRTCTTYKLKGVACPLICNLNGCDCNDGYVFDNDPAVQKCVLPKDCTPNCGRYEVISNCTNGGCDARNCSQAGKPVPCVKLDPKNCIKGCVCQSGYLRAKNGTCVPQNQCNEGCKNDPNSHPGCGVNCGKTCTTYKLKGVACPLICNLNGCDCNDGYVFDNDPAVQKCVLPKDCTPKCGRYEVISNCTNGGCDARNCSQAGKPVPCVKLDPKNCIKGCVCQSGYLRAKNGTCVPQNQCNEGCKNDPNSHPGCGVNCGKTCTTYKLKGVACPLICNLNGCDCNDGYVFDNDPAVQKCVLPKDCTPKCGRYEVISNCTNGGCDARNCSQAGKPVPCVKLDPKNCIKGCVCKSGYLRAKNGTCVPQNQCNEGCKNDPNAHPGCGVNCGRTCSTYKKKDVACIAICYLNGCDCNDGYVFDDNPAVQKCVLPKDCTPKCGQYEVLSNCTNGGCDARNCSQAGKPVPCVKLDPKNCIKGCVCQSGYLRAKNGTCVLKNQCNEGCGNDPNAHPDCGVNCGKTCQKTRICPRICKVDGCDCNDGYFFDGIQGICVKEKDCTPICGLNEIYMSCINGGCGYKNCSQIGQPQLCVDPAPGYCVKGCTCASGYLRAPNGTCVPQDQCPVTGCNGDPNAERGCGYNCGKTCRSYNINKNLCPRLQCTPDKCDCKDGYYLDENINKCVLLKDCSPQCGRNEMYSNCINGGCGYKNCSQIGQPKLCVDPIRCIKGCLCASGYLRAPNGTCVPQDQCPKKVTCNKPNEVYDPCIPPCPPRRCDVDDRLIKCAAPPQPGDPECQSGCRCAEGYARNATGTCVLRKNCEKPLTCGPNEMYQRCPAPCPGDSCKVNPALVLCLAGPNYGDPACKPACTCIDGFARNDDNQCVPRDQCPPPKNDQCTGQNEIYDDCISGCSNQTCDEIGKTYQCPIQTTVCRTGCRCKPGYYRDASNNCIPESECPPQCGRNEMYSNCINGGCGYKNCSQIGQPKLCVDPIRCIKGCLCASGYLRAPNGTCVPQDQCPKKEKCNKPNEVFDSCIPPCPPRRCDVDDSIIRCAAPPQPGDPECQSGCRCADGYARNATGTCVLRKNCEKPLPCGPNETYQRCPAPCPGDSCKVNPALVRCKPGPNYGDSACKPACTCVDGYARNDYNQCVPRDQCPPPTNNKCKGQNEIYDDCISGCSNQTCDEIGKIFSCPLQPAVCRTGCRCKPGYYRNASLTCVAESECPTPPCADDEIYSRCPAVKCDAENCPKDRNSPLTCPIGIICDPPRCVCGFNRHRDRKTGKCIPTANCPPFKCGPNEVYKPCSGSCPGETCADYINSTKCPPYRIGIVVPCMPACKCIDGYYRNSTGMCIPGYKCGPKTTTKPPVVVSSTTPLTTTEPPTTTEDNCITVSYSTNTVDKLQAGITSFTGKFLYDRIKSGKGENIIASPYSVVPLLAVLFLYTNGVAFNQLANVLNVSDKQEIRSGFPALASLFEGQTSVNFSTGANIYSDSNNYPLSDAFIQDAVDVIDAGAENLDFSQNVQAAETINNWVKKQTNNKITDLISPDDLSPLTRLVLVNAIYFKGNWVSQFNKANTQDADFYLSDGTTKKTKLMYQQAQFNYGEVPDMNLTALEMYYEGRNFSMLFVLPNKNDGVTQTAEYLQSPENLEKVVGSLSSQKVKVYIPPFEIKTTTDLTEILKQEGVTKIFDPADSGLTGLLKTEEDTCVTKAIQKAFIKVDENGSEAAAANGVVVSTRSLPLPPVDPVVFRADHAFLFYIRLQGATMFCGAYVQ